MKRVLVTGGAGFIGSHLCKKLVEKGIEVLCVDNFFTGSKKNIAALLDNKNFELFRHDITEPILLEADSVFNLACPASPIHYQANPIKTIKTNVLGTLNMLGLARRTGARILQASTSEVYGDPLEHPQKESYFGNVNPNGMRSCYDEGKRCAESLLYSYNREQNVDVRVVRIFNTYGPNMLENDGRVVSNFIVQALGGEDITIYGDGSQTRSFCYVDDMVDGMIKTMESDYINPINLGNPVEQSIKEIALTIKEMTGSSSKIVYKNMPKDDPLRRKPDISLAIKELGWEPTVSFEEGLGKTIEYFKKVV